MHIILALLAKATTDVIPIGIEDIQTAKQALNAELNKAKKSPA